MPHGPRVAMQNHATGVWNRWWVSSWVNTIDLLAMARLVIWLLELSEY